MDVNYTIGEIYTPMSYEDFDNAVVIIGLADKGPKMIPVYLSDSEYVEDAFGEGSELSNACLEAFYAGAQRIIAFRINGIYPVYVLTDANGNELIKLYAIHAGGKYNMMKVIVSPIDADSKSLGIYGIDGELQMEYILNNTTTSSALCNIINRDSKLGRVEVIAEPLNDFAPSSTIRSTGEEGRFFIDGRDEPNVFDEQLYNRLATIYSMLETINFDIIIPLPVIYTDYTVVSTENTETPKNKSFYNQLVDFCEIKAASGYPVIAIASADEFIPEQHITLSGYITALKNKVENGDLNLNRSQYVILLRTWLSTPFLDNNGIKYISSGRAALGGLLNSLDCHISPANKFIWSSLRIYEDDTMKYEFNPSETESLSALGICTFRNSIRKGVVISNAITSALNNDPCATIRNSRLSNYINKTLTSVFESYIGNTYINQYSAINNLINSTLETIKSNQMIADYQYTVASDSFGSYISVDIEVVPYGEVKAITASILVHL